MRNPNLSIIVNFEGKKQGMTNLFNELAISEKFTGECWFVRTYVLLSSQYPGSLFLRCASEKRMNLNCIL